ncbi:hypothetical protein RBI80_18980 [Klebsiella variicola]|nr:hypothetical protein RBI80_18980 [Klebsiella variicola]
MDYITEGVLDKVINDLTYRANKARKARFLIGGSIILIATMLSGFITYRLTTNQSDSSLANTFMAFRDRFVVSEDGGLRGFINKELGQVYESEKDVVRLRVENESSIPSEKTKLTMTGMVGRSHKPLIRKRLWIMQVGWLIFTQKWLRRITVNQ